MAKPAKLIAVIDYDRCVGVGMCMVHAPAAFSRNKESLASFNAQGAFTAAEMREAADACPMSAITLHEVDDGELVAT